MTRTPRSYFERLYVDNPDPWGFATRWYERRKYDLTVAALPAPRYRYGFEPGCSIGVLTTVLADRCDRLLAGDHVDAAVAAARQRTAERRNVEVRALAVPDDWPEETFDLIVLSELGYYLDATELRECCSHIMTTLEPGGSLLAVHWRGRSDYPLTGEAVHRLIGSRTELPRAAHYEEPSFILDVWQRR